MCVERVVVFNESTCVCVQPFAPPTQCLNVLQPADLHTAFTTALSRLVHIISIDLTFKQRPACIQNTRLHIGVHIHKILIEVEGVRVSSGIRLKRCTNLAAWSQISQI